MSKTNRNQFNYKAPILVILIGFSLSIWLGLELYSASKRLEAARFAQLTEQVEAKIEAHFESYFDTLRANAAFYVNSENFLHAEWADYVDRLTIEERFPGILGFGFINAFDHSQLKKFEIEMRLNGIPNFQVKSLSKEIQPDERFIITHIEPLKQNLSALGLDVGSESNRREGILRARKTGKGSITGRIELIQKESDRTSYLLYYPIVIDKTPISTWAYAPFSANSFFSKTLRANDQTLDFTVYEGENDEAKNLIFQSNSLLKIGEVATPQTRTSIVKLAGHPFTINWTKGETYVGQHATGSILAGLGLAFASLLVSAIIFNTQNLRLRANRISKQKTAELILANKSLEQEVAERKNAEENALKAREFAESATRIKGDFLATVSHEIRTPMNSIIGFAELMTESELTTEQRVWITHVHNSGNALLRIINDILDLSKIESGNLELENSPVCLQETLQEAVDSLTPIAAQKALSIQFIAENFVPKLVMGDSVRLNQMVINLLGNSIKFTEAGSVRLTLTWEGDENEGTAMIIIEDTGIGIETKDIDTLFEKFTQADSSTTRRFGGTGLGLSITKKIIDLMHGSIQVSSEIGKGTKFLIRTPFKVVSTPKVETKKRIETLKPTSVPFPKRDAIEVLIVDDNLVNQKLASTILSRLDCNVTSASDGAQAIQQVKKKDFKIIFMDCQMPILNGFDATTEIRRMEEDGELGQGETRKRTKIVALTAGITDETKKKCMAVGMDNYIRKPSKIADFKAIIDSYHRHLNKTLPEPRSIEWSKIKE